MQEFTNNFIDTGIGIWLVERLLDLVESDKSIRGYGVILCLQKWTANFKGQFMRLI